MFTQCPECSVAFRVTAEVLRQAAGKVRCGGCGVAFNALDYLSEDKPQSRTKSETERRLPELAPAPRGDAGNESRMQSISAEQSAALLKTLDQLAGEDIRIEDTGVEWRVLDVNEPAQDSDAIANDEIATTDTGSLKFVLQTTDDGSPAVIDQRGHFEGAVSDADAAPEEMRFDDNTQLPDDFGVDSESALQAAAADLIVENAAQPADPDSSQIDVALGDPDEWQDLLGEVDEERATDSGLDHAEEALTHGEEFAADTAEPATDGPPDVDTQFALQAEAMGVDLSGMHATVDATQAAAADENAAAETSIDDDLIAAAFESEAAARAEATAATSLHPDLASDEHGDALDEALDIEATAAARLAEEPTELAPLEPAETGDRDELFEAAATEPDAFEDQAAPLEAVSTEPDAFDDQAEQLEAVTAEPDAVEDQGAPLEADTTEPDAVEDQAEQLEAGTTEPDDFEDRADQVEAAAAEPDAVEDRAAPLEAAATEAASTDVEETPADTAEHDAGAPDHIEIEMLDPASESAEHEIPEMTEEEMTINMMIDQDLLAIAVEDEDGFASTIVQIQPDGKDDEAGKKVKAKTSQRAAGDVPLVETIIMEGETFRGALDDEREAAKAGFVAQARKAVESQFRDDPEERRPVNSRMIIGVVLLVLLLAAQAVHQLRESLATVPAFNQSIGPIYRTFGNPVTPAWDVSGWRFEATKGSTDDRDEFLTIYSRIGNNSEEALPYPLVHVSLTDRFEEIVGSRVLEPAAYLVDDSDPRQMVASGSTFDAVISIESPATEATGFKLNVCYRTAGGQLRCAIEDFR